MYTSVNLIILAVCTFLTGLSAGLCFTWANAITPGIGNLNDLEYLKAFQQMNRVIINPTFLLVFIGPTVLHIYIAFFLKSGSNSIFWIVSVAAVLYIIGLTLVTIFGNVPLNEMLDKTNLESISKEDLTNMRLKFEHKWNSFHFIRTLSSCISFALLLFSIILYSKNLN